MTSNGHAGHAVHFIQTVNDVPVYGADIVVNVTPDNRVPFALLNHRVEVSVPTTEAVSKPRRLVRLRFSTSVWRARSTWIAPRW